MAADIGNNRCHCPAGQGFLGCPEQLGDIGRSHEDQGIGVKTEAYQPRPIGHAEPLRLSHQLEINNGGPLPCQERTGLIQRKTQGGTTLALLVGEHFLQQSATENGKASILRFHPLAGFGEGGLALDLGNTVPQRGKALLLIWRSHGSGSAVLLEQNGNS
jgi:hypothetical protein